VDGDLLRTWKGGELSPLERRTLVAAMVDRVILHRSQRATKKKIDPQRVQIVLKGNVLLSPKTVPVRGKMTEPVQSYGRLGPTHGNLDKKRRASCSS
jgi:hypothetical protein